MMLAMYVAAAVHHLAVAAPGRLPKSLKPTNTLPNDQQFLPAPPPPFLPALPPLRPAPEGGSGGGGPPPSSACTTTGGSPCAFPFVYQGVEYTACTGAGRKDGIAYCGTAQDPTTHGHWVGGYCNSDCPMDETVTTTQDEVLANAELCPGGWHLGRPERTGGVEYHYAVDGSMMNLAECAAVAAYYTGTLGMPVTAWGHFEGIRALHDPADADYCTLYFGEFAPSDVDQPGDTELYCKSKSAAPPNAAGSLAETVAADPDGSLEALCPHGWKLLNDYYHPGGGYMGNGNTFVSMPDWVTPSECAAAAAAAGKGWSVMLSAVLAPQQWDDRKDWCRLFEADIAADERDELAATRTSMNRAAFFCPPAPPSTKDALAAVCSEATDAGSLDRTFCECNLWGGATDPDGAWGRTCAEFFTSYSNDDGTPDQYYCRGYVDFSPTRPQTTGMGGNGYPCEGTLPDFGVYPELADLCPDQCQTTAPTTTTTATTTTTTTTTATTTTAAPTTTEAACTDNASWVAKSKKKNKKGNKNGNKTETANGCSWVAMNPRTRCKTKSKGGTSAFAGCPAACNQC